MLGRNARAAARRLSLARAPSRRTRRFAAMAAAIRAAARGDPRRQCAMTSPGREGGWARRRRSSIVSRSTRPASRRSRRRSRASPRCPIRSGACSRRFERPNGLDDRARRDAARRHRGHLREPPQRHGRCRRAVPQGRQRRDPARRLGQLPLVERRSSPAMVEGLDRRPACRRDAIQLVPTRDRAAVGAMLAGLDGDHRRHRAARRQEPRRARAGGGAGAGLRPSRGHLPRLCRMARGSRRWHSDIVLNAKMRRTGVCGAAETLLVDRAVRGDASCSR